MPPGRSAGDGKREGASMGNSGDAVAQLATDLPNLEESLKVTPSSAMPAP
jgi:hypothetical protein